MKNNKGFSLVELIVVVLIMGILAVALTPQVMKWVDRSRSAADNNTKEAVVEAVNLTLTNSNAVAAVGSDATKNTIVVNGTGVTYGTGLGTNFMNKFYEYSGAKSGDAKAFVVKKSGNSFTVTITVTAGVPKVEVTLGGTWADISDD